MPPALAAGESFAGVYVPLVSQAVLDGNDEGQEPKLNLKVRARRPAGVRGYVVWCSDDWGGRRVVGAPAC